MDSSSSTVPATLISMQYDFLKWVTNWMQNKDHSVDKQNLIDLPNIVHLLQALGFHIRSVDICDPEDIAVLKDGNRGVRVVATCKHSGQRIVLEQPTEKRNCQCVKVPPIGSANAMWEVVATAPSKSANQSSSVIETGTDIIPEISSELKGFLKPITRRLIDMVEKDKASSTIRKPRRHSERYPSPTERMAMDSPRSDHWLSTNFRASSPYSRYHSLETLIVPNETIPFQTPKPYGILSSPTTLSQNGAQSTPNLRLSTIADYRNSRSTIGEDRVISQTQFNLIKEAANCIATFISTVEDKSFRCSSDSVFNKERLEIRKTPLKSKAVSSPNLRRSTSGTSTIPLQKKNLATSTSSSNIKLKSKSTSKLGEAKKPKLKKSGSIDEGKVQACSIQRRAPNYMHTSNQPYRKLQLKRNKIIKEVGRSTRSGTKAKTSRLWKDVKQFRSKRYFNLH